MRGGERGEERERGSDRQIQSQTGTDRKTETETDSQLSHGQADSKSARGSDSRPPGTSLAHKQTGCAGWRPERPDSQVRDARLAHGRGDGFDRRAERVEQLGHLASAASLPALLHDKARQGNDVRIEGRLVRHAGAGMLRAGRQVRTGRRQDTAGTQRKDGPRPSSCPHSLER